MGKYGFVMVWLLLFAIPWENVLVIPGFGTVSRVAGFAAIGAAMLSIFIGGKKLRFHNFHLAMVLFIFLIGLSYFWSIDPENGLKGIMTFIQLLAMSWLIFQSAISEERVRSLMTAYVAGAYVTVGTILNGLFSADHWKRFGAEGFNPNDTAIILALGIPMAWYLAEKMGRGIMASSLYFYPFFALTGILLTASRNGLLAAVLAFLFILFSLARRSMWKNFVFAVVATATVAIGFSIVPEASLMRLGTFGDSLARGMNSRWEIWQTGFQMFGERPILGWGIASFRTAIEPYYGTMAAPHNVYLSILVEQGIVGFAAFCLILGVVFFSLPELPSAERALWIVLLGIWCICAFALNWEWRKQTWFLLTLAITHATAFAPAAPQIEKRVVTV
ncbi:MAG: O-antigen ligase family protein [Desulfuromonadales bacterium]